MGTMAKAMNGGCTWSNWPTGQPTFGRTGKQPALASQHPGYGRSKLNDRN
jgi:hypothetical protein